MTERQLEFFEKIDHLGTGDRAALRRAAGRPINKASAAAWTAFYKCYPPGSKWQEPYQFAAASLHCLWPSDQKNRLSMPEILRQAFGKEDSDSSKHRIIALLEQDWDEDGFFIAKLTRIMKMIRSKGIAVDCADLLEDLQRWNSDSQSVQRKWARALCSIQEEENKRGEL